MKLSRRLRITLGVLALLLVWYAVAFFTQRDGIREAVFRYEMSRLSDSADAFYLSVEGQRDPSDALLARFAGGNVLVAKASKVHFLQPPPHGNVVAGSTPGRLGEMLSLESVRLFLPFLAVVHGNTYMAPLSAAGYRYVVIWAGNRWVVLSDKVQWVS